MFQVHVLDVDGYKPRNPYTHCLKVCMTKEILQAQKVTVPDTNEYIDR